MVDPFGEELFAACWLFVQGLPEVIPIDAFKIPSLPVMTGTLIFNLILLLIESEGGPCHVSNL